MPLQDIRKYFDDLNYNSYITLSVHKCFYKVVQYNINEKYGYRQYILINHHIRYNILVLPLIVMSYE